MSLHKWGVSAQRHGRGSVLGAEVSMQLQHSPLLPDRQSNAAAYLLRGIVGGELQESASGVGSWEEGRAQQYDLYPR